MKLEQIVLTEEEVALIEAAKNPTKKRKTNLKDQELVDYLNVMRESNPEYYQQLLNMD